MTDGILSGVGSVVVFLPQIVILFFFILAMEASGYMARAAFLMDRLMAGVGLSGRSFIPLLSSFACAIPGIMATRSITDPKDRLTTILIAPLMTCSARLPVYAVIIAAFIPNRVGRPGIGLQGLVLFALYVYRASSARCWWRWCCAARSPRARQRLHHGTAQVPDAAPVKDLLIGLWQRAWIFLRRAGTIIFMVTMVLWLLLNFPARRPKGENQVDASIAGKLANGLAVVVEPIGFNRDIALSLIPAMAAREVAVSSLATTYAVAATTRTRRPWRWATGSRRAGACRWRSRSSPGSSSRRSACRPSPSPGAKPTAGNGRAFMLAYLFALALPRVRRPDFGRRWGWAVARSALWETAPDSRHPAAYALVSGPEFKGTSIRWQAASTRSSGRQSGRQDPEVKSFQNGGRICNLRIATSESWKDKATGERKERTEWHTVVLQSDGLVGVAERYLRKGSKVYIEGQLRTRKWQDQSGNDRYSTEIVGRHAAAC
jgi:hypothetical protein